MFQSLSHLPPIPQKNCVFGATKHYNTYTNHQLLSEPDEYKFLKKHPKELYDKIIQHLKSTVYPKYEVRDECFRLLTHVPGFRPQCLPSINGQSTNSCMAISYSFHLLLHQFYFLHIFQNVEHFCIFFKMFSPVLYRTTIELDGLYYPIQQNAFITNGSPILVISSQRAVAHTFALFMTAIFS